MAIKIPLLLDVYQIKPIGSLHRRTNNEKKWTVLGICAVLAFVMTGFCAYGEEQTEPGTGETVETFLAPGERRKPGVNWTEQITHGSPRQRQEPLLAAAGFAGAIRSMKLHIFTPRAPFGSPGATLVAAFQAFSAWPRASFGVSPGRGATTIASGFCYRGQPPEPTYSDTAVIEYICSCP